MISILLLGILLFNWVGFRIVSFWLEQQATAQLELQLDNREYNESDLITVKIPATHLSAYTLSGQFERVNGQVDWNGTRYKYVKSRIFNDSLELLCIPDQRGTQVLNARDDFFKLVNDLQTTGQNKKTDDRSASSRPFSTDYYIIHDLFRLNNPSLIISSGTYYSTENIISVYSSTPEQPPDKQGSLG